jgi:hypothetical protein
LTLDKSKKAKEIAKSNEIIIARVRDKIKPNVHLKIQQATSEQSFGI